METKKLEIAKKMNNAVGDVISNNSLIGFERAYQIATAAGLLKQMLTPEYMKPIMDLQGNRLGFKTDKDGQNGYSEDTVKNCLIEAVLTGVQPFGNQFNIIAGNCYITKEGFGYLLANFKGLSYDIVPSLPRINGNSAAVVMKVSYSLHGGELKTKEIDIPVKVNQYMGTDAVIGKATRKARAWLYNTITGSEVADGDASDNDALKTINIQAIEPTAGEKEEDRITQFIHNAKSIKQLEEVQGLPMNDVQIALLKAKINQLNEK